MTIRIPGRQVGGKLVRSEAGSAGVTVQRKPYASPRVEVVDIESLVELLGPAQADYNGVPFP